jgi:hypothetical protein
MIDLLRLDPEQRHYKMRCQTLLDESKAFFTRMGHSGIDVRRIFSARPFQSTFRREWRLTCGRCGGELIVDTSPPGSDTKFGGIRGCETVCKPDKPYKHGVYEPQPRPRMR